MNKTELQQKIVDMEKQLAELKKELDKKDKGIWKPKKLENYWYIDNDGKVLLDNNGEFSVDRNKINFNNHYKTEEEAIKQANYLKYTNLLRKYVEEHSEPIDWNDNEQKYCIWYDHQLNKEIIISGTILQQQGTIYASSEEVLKEAIDFVGEENIKKYIFGVEE